VYTSCRERWEVRPQTRMQGRDEVGSRYSDGFANTRRSVPSSKAMATHQRRLVEQEEEAVLVQQSGADLFG
jgi:hypothetical protein